MSDRENGDVSQERWLGARWSSWGCLALLGSLAIAGLAVVTVVYGISTIPRAFGPNGLLSPAPELIPPFEPPAERERFIGVPPVGVPEFTTGHTIRFDNGAQFTVTRTALDWAPPPPQTPEREYIVVGVQLVNRGGGPVPLSPSSFRVETAGPAPREVSGPLDTSTVPDRLADRTVLPGETAEGALVFLREDIRQIRKYLLYSPPFYEGTIRILLVP